jgi:outer membrane protein
MKINMTLKQLSFLVLTVLLIHSVGNAQETKNLSLDEAIQLSQQNSNHLKLSDAKVQEATAVLREARERMLPDLSISGAYLRLNKPTVDLKINLGGSGSESTDGGSTGGSSSSSGVEVNQAMYGIASLSLPLFSGLRIQHGIESAKYLAKAAKMDAEKDRQEIIENTIAAYCNLFKAKEAMDIVKENLKQSQQRVADFSNLEKNGLMARNDLLKAQLQQSNIELSLLDAENNWKITYINMNLMLGLDENTILTPDVNSFQPVADAGNFEQWESSALENRKDIAALNMRSKAANAGVKAAKGEYYPSVALTGGYIAADVPNVLTITNAINAGVGLKYSPSSLWKAGSKVEQAKAKLQQVQTNQAILSDAIRLQTAQAYQALLSNNKKIEVYAKAQEQANENYRIVKNKYDNSLANTTDLLEADVAQLQAKLNYAFSKADAVVAYNKLLLAAGMLNNK